jgi:ribosomal protein S18 acetylase RimI-like enzyme
MLVFRNLRSDDISALAKIVRETHFFTEAEVAVAVELMEDKTGYYQFIVAEEDSRILGYSCYGHIAVTESSYDLYWIVVSPAAQGKSVGKKLMAETQQRIKAEGGARAYAETSSQEKYLSTQRFYEKCGFTKEAELKDFYRIGDSRLTFTKILN